MTPYKDLAELIAKAESNNWPYAVRYEPKFIPDDRAVKFAAIGNRCTYDTAKIICKTSYGLYQIMGSNLYLNGVTGSIVQFCTDATMQLMQFHTFLLSRGINFTLEEMLADDSKLRTFAHRYNGDPEKYGNYLLSLVKLGKV